MRRKRRNKGTWFPILGTGLPGANDDISARDFIINVAGGGQQTVVAPLTYDVPSEGDTVGADDPGVLAGIVGQEYFLRRLVGKLHVSCDVIASSTGAGAAYLVGAGFFVARAADADAGGGPNLPIGAAGAAELLENYSPLHHNTIREPWIWRRTWILGTTVGDSLASDPFSSYNIHGPHNNAGYPGVLDGPHVDAKTARRVALDERLWFALGCVPLQLGVAPSTLQGGINAILDIRAFAQLTRARNRGVF